MGGEVAGRHREALAGNDEDQQAALGQIPGAVGEEGVLDALVLLVPIVRRVQKEQAEGPVCHRGLEQVHGEGAVEPLLRRLSPVPVKLHAVGLDGEASPRAQLHRQVAPRRLRPRSRGRGCAASPGCSGGSRRAYLSARRSCPPPAPGWGSTPLLPEQPVSMSSLLSVCLACPSKARTGRVRAGRSGSPSAPWGAARSPRAATAWKTTWIPQWYISPVWRFLSNSSVVQNRSSQWGQVKNSVCSLVIGLSPFLRRLQAAICDIPVAVPLDAHHLAHGQVPLVAQDLVRPDALGAGGAEGGYQLGAVGDGHAAHQRRAALRQRVAVERDRGVALIRLGGGPVEVGLRRANQVLRPIVLAVAAVNAVR